MEISSVEDIYKALTGQGTLEWLGESKSAAVLYFSRGRRRYKIFLMTAMWRFPAGTSCSAESTGTAWGCAGMSSLRTASRTCMRR